MPRPADGRLKPTRSTPNCVSSQADVNDRVHYIAPLTFTGEVDAAVARLKALLNTWPRTHIIEEDVGWLHVTCATRIFGWIDDVHLLLEPETHHIHVRSASRVGNGDLGTNRRRVERLRREWEAAR